MPSTSTITAFNTFVPDTNIVSADMNTNFSNFRGNIIPIDPNTATAASTMTYDLGSVDHNWKGVYNQYSIMYGNTAGSIPTVPTSTAYGLYFKENGKLYKKTSAGVEAEVGSGGGGSVNLITDGDAEGANIWTAYADAAATRPVDGTGGSPNVTATISSSTPLIGSNSFVFTKDAANRQGQGIATTFSVDLGYRAKVMQIEFDYIVGSGTFAAGSSSTDSDLIVYIYDVTNSALIEPSSIKLLSNSTSIGDKFIANFQTSATGASYRLILHCATTSASAYTVKLDSVRVGPCNYVYGTPITDWTSFTPTGSWSTNTTYTGRWRRVGQNMELYYELVLGGAPTAAQLVLNLPSGFTIDRTKLPGLDDSSIFIGQGGGFRTGVSNHSFGLRINGTTQLAPVIHNASGTYAVDNGITNTVPVAWGSGDDLFFTASIPIQGWSSSIQMSDSVVWDDDIGQVQAFAFASTSPPNGYIYADGSAISRATYRDLFNKIGTTFGVGDGSTTFNIPDMRGIFVRGSGSQTISGTVYTGTLGTKERDAVQDHAHRQLLTNGVASGTYYADRYASTGESDYGSSNTGGMVSGRSAAETRPANISLTYFIKYARGVSPIVSMTEKCIYSASNSAGTTVATGATGTIIPFATVSKDTHGIFSAGVFTASRTMDVDVSAMLQFTANSTGYRGAKVMKNGSLFRYIGLNGTPSATNGCAVSGSCIVPLLAGETVSIYGEQNSGGNLNLQADGSSNWISIKEIK